MNVVYQLSKKLNISEIDVAQQLLRAPLHYKVYKIPKRTFGSRTIAQPTAQLKRLQRAFLDLVELPAHSAAMAYRQGMSIKDNARHHASNRYLLKVDLHNFFNSITPIIFWQEWSCFFAPLGDTERKNIENLLFWSPRYFSRARFILSVGAPSSPNVSNFIMFRLDKKLQKLCIDKKITYTRYADDLTFSTNVRNVLFELPNLVTELLDEFFSGRLTINKRKTVYSSKAHNRHITGICLTNDGNLSLGRARKRYLKHLVHQFIVERLDEEKILELRGWLAFANHIEPLFLISLRNKYGTGVIDKINRGSDV